ncbi:hypothetical protein [Sorangium sp. So ce887]|uniref:hypothetical protein n=1 Tax=Sorangium sp. So ce887 TaxID=3133324 RepID=UPI003F5F9D04
MSKLAELDAVPAVGEHFRADRERRVSGVRLDAERGEHVVTLEEDDFDRVVYADPEKHWSHLDAMTARGWEVEFERSLRINLMLSFVPRPDTTEEALRDAAAVTERVAAFWSNPGGWPSQETLDALKDTRLDWMASLARGLGRRVEEVRLSPDDPGTLIIAWVHLRALTECYLRLFLVVFLADYVKSPHAKKRGSKVAMPGTQKVRFEDLRQFMNKENIIDRHGGFVETVQQRGNAIHPFLNRDIGTAADFEEYVRGFIPFMRELARAMPMPHVDEVISPPPDVGCLSTRPISERPPWDR